MTDLREAVEALVRLRGRSHRLPGRISLDLRGAVGRLVIDNPEHRHAMTLGMMEDLGRSVQRLQSWSGSVVLIDSSTPDAFCSGGHLGEVSSSWLNEGAGRVMSEAMTTVTDALFGLPQVTVAVIRGPAVGGGAELATAADHRVFAETAWVQFKHAALGVAAGWGGVNRLVHHVRPRVALRWMTTADRIDARLAQRVGFADLVGPDPQALADGLIEPIMALPAAGVRAVKLQVAAARTGGDRAASLAAFLSVWGGPEHRKALKARDA